MIWFFIIPVILWLMVMSFPLTPTRMYSNAFDRVTKAKYRNDRAGLQIMLDHLRSFPEQWSISRDSASFPLQGAKQIYLHFDDKKGWEYTLNNFGGRARPLDGHFGKQFVEQLTLENNRRESQALLRSFYPELDGTLLLK